MSNSGFPKEARFRRLKKLRRNKDGEVISRRSVPGVWLCTKPVGEDFVAFGIARCSKRDENKLLSGKGTAYNRCKDGEALGLRLGTDEPLPRRGVVQKDQMPSLVQRFYAEKFDRDGWRDNPADWEASAWSE